MKKIVLLTIIVMCLFFMAGCIQDGDNGSSAGSVQDYFPIIENTRYVYEGEGNEFAFYDVYIDYASDNKVQQRINNGGTEQVKVIAIEDGKLVNQFSRGEIYYRQNFLEVTGDQADILLMDPIKEGTTWTLEDSSVRAITDTSADVVTPSGSYKAVEVVTDGQYGKTVDYYVKDIGLVKTVFITEGSEISSSLSKIVEDVSLSQTVRFFYPNIDDSKYYYKDVEVSFRTNDITGDVLDAIYKEPISSPLGKVFSPNTKINSLYINDDGIVYIDLNRTFLTEMNAGSGYEGMILQSIANTFGSYYNSEKVILTIDGGLYESGHIAMMEGEYMTVDYNDIVVIQ